jgi:hypothetical protein
MGLVTSSRDFNLRLYLVTMNSKSERKNNKIYTTYKCGNRNDKIQRGRGRSSKAY